ncbi:hypothetical protein DFH11DRAFT_230763 [Phellopilus nigrolimitatus]|nr:hypothetical protein DFH11DRAFT_230763 [Phellopilus nigrolimitatus]
MYTRMLPARHTLISMCPILFPCTQPRSPLHRSHTRLLGRTTPTQPPGPKRQRRLGGARLAWRAQCDRCHAAHAHEYPNPQYLQYDARAPPSPCPRARARRFHTAFFLARYPCTRTRQCLSRCPSPPTARVRVQRGARLLAVPRADRTSGLPFKRRAVP